MRTTFWSWLVVCVLCAEALGCASRGRVAEVSDEAIEERPAERPAARGGADGAEHIELTVESEDDEREEVEVERGWDSAGVVVPEGVAGAHLRWVLDRLEVGGGMPDLDEASERFSEAFLAQVPARQLGAVMRQLSAALGSFVLREVEAQEGGRMLVGVLDGADGNVYRVVVGVEEGEELMETLLVQLAPDLMAQDVGDWDGVREALAGAGARVSMLAAELGAAGCVALESEAPGEVLAVGSTFKLWVLGALVDAVVAGDVSWEDELELRAAWRSIPSGVMQDREVGTRYPVLEYATEMIRRSDNTATDHLILTLGRERVEGSLAAWGVADPARNQPFLTTREMTGLKLQRAAEARERWIAGDVEARRVVLAEEPVDFDVMEALMASGPWTTPRYIEELEWHASAEDLCRTMDRFRRVSMEEEEGRRAVEVLGMNPGLAIDREQWPYVGYKGGSEPGVLNMSWLLLREDGRWFALVLTANDASAPVVDARLMSAATTALRLLAQVE